MRASRALAVGLAVVFLAGCGGRNGTAAPKLLKPLQVTLDGWKGPQTAGILMAAYRGYFTDVGLHPTVLVPGLPNLSIKYVVTEVDDIGITHEPEAVLAKERGAPIVIVGSLVKQPTAAMIWLKKSQIHGIADLKGKTIAIPGYSSQRKLLRSVLSRAGLKLSDVKVKNVGYDLVSELAGGHVDAIFGGAWNLEGAELETRGLEPVVTRVTSLGVPPYDELVVVARSDRVAREPQLIRDFMSAVSRGTAAAVEHPEEIVKTIEGYDYANPETSREALKAQIKATTPLLSRDGYVSPGQARGLIEWMHEEGMVQRKLPVGSLLTNAYLHSP